MGSEKSLRYDDLERIFGNEIKNTMVGSWGFNEECIAIVIKTSAALAPAQAKLQSLGISFHKEIDAGRTFLVLRDINLI